MGNAPSLPPRKKIYSTQSGILLKENIFAGKNLTAFFLSSGCVWLISVGYLFDVDDCVQLPVF